MQDGAVSSRLGIKVERRKKITELERGGDWGCGEETTRVNSLRGGVEW